MPFLYIFLVLLGQISLEALYYCIGLIPSQFYANLGSIQRLSALFLQLVFFTICITVVKGLKTLALSMGKFHGQQEMGRMVISSFLSKHAFLALSCMGDVEQRVLDDVKKTCELEATILDRVTLLPLLIIFYTCRCFVIVPYPPAVPLIYGYAILGAILVRSPMARLQSLLAAWDASEGIAKTHLCQISSNAESIFLTDGIGWNRARFIDYFTNTVVHNGVCVGTLESLIESFKSFVSYLGASINYLIIVLFISSSTPQSIDAATVSQHSFLCLMLVAKLDEAIGCIDLVAKWRVYRNRIAEIISLQSIEKPTESIDHLLLKNVTVDDPIKLPWSLSIDTQCHRVVCISGANGSGKTALVKRISGIWSGSGTVHIPKDAMIIPQGAFAVFDCNSLTDLLNYPYIDKRFDEQKVQLALGIVKLAVIPRTPGEWQRLHLARVFLFRPKLAILDEAIGHIEEEDAERIVTEMLRVCHDTRFIFLSPNPPRSLMFCNPLMIRLSPIDDQYAKPR